MLACRKWTTCGQVAAASVNEDLDEVAEALHELEEDCFEVPFLVFIRLFLDLCLGST